MNTVYNPDSVRGALQKIQNFVTVNYIPKLQPRESVSVAFRDESDPDIDRKFGFGQDGRIWYSCGNLSMYFAEPRDGDPSQSVYSLWPYAVPLILSWQSVKAEIERRMRQVENDRDVISNFEP